MAFWRELPIIAVTAVFSILATLSVTALTREPQLTMSDVMRTVRAEGQYVTRRDVEEMIADKVPYGRDRDEIFARLRTLEQQFTRIETKLDLLISREAVQDGVRRVSPPGDHNP